MQENSMDQPTSLSQLLRESYLAESRAHHRHGESTDPPRRLVYGTLKEKNQESCAKLDTPIPDLSAFLNQEELDKSVDLACKAISDDPQERDQKSAKPQIESTPKKVQENTHRTNVADFKRAQRTAPYGMETQSKKEFLNKAADFIEELSSLFKANSSKRIRPRSCKAHRSRYQNKPQPDGASFSVNAEDRERPVIQPMEETMEDTREPEPTAAGTVCESTDMVQSESLEEPECEPPQFIQKLKSREVAEGSKVQLDCIIRGKPAPEVRWFCEGKELENSPDIQIITDGERHSLIIAEAFEEDTGRYSCFASNFYGTDSTSAEIYIEGASSSDSDGEQHYPAQLHKRSQPKPAVVSVESSSSLEDTTSTVTITCAEAPAPEAVPLTKLTPDQPLQPEETEPQSFEIFSSATPVEHPIVPFPEPVIEPALPVLEPVKEPTISVLEPTIEPTISVLEPTISVLESVIEPAISVLEPTISLAEPTISVLEPTIEPTVSVLEPTISLLGPVIEPAILAVEPTISVLESTISVREPVIEPTIPVLEPPTPILEVEPSPPPSSQSIPDLLLTSQQSISESLNGSSSYVQSFDVRPMMAAPVFTKNLQDVLALESQLVVLECRVKGVPSPKVDWYREGMLIDDSPDFRILQKKPRSMAESEEICTLVIAEVFPEDSGTFTCTASNKYGTVSSTANLSVKGHNNNTTNAKKTSMLTVESSLPKVPTTDLISTTLTRKPDLPLVNNKLHSSMICLDPLNSGFKQSYPLDGGTFRSDSLNTSTLRHDLSTSLPSLNPISIGKYSSDTLRSRLPQTDPLGFSAFSPNSDLTHKPLSSSTPHFDSGGSGFNSSTDVTQSPPNGLASSITLSTDTCLEPSPNASKSILSPCITSPPLLNSNNHQERPPVKPLPDPPTSCLKTRPEGVLGNHNESRSSSRVGLRVTFKLPEDEEEEEKGLSSKGPPPVLAKPKLDPSQLQILHNQVLLEQRQDNVSPSLESQHLDETSCEALPITPTQLSVNPFPSAFRPTPNVMDSGPFPQLIPASIPPPPAGPAPILKATPASQFSISLPNSMPLPQLTPSTTLNILPSSPQQNMVPTTFMNTDAPITVPSTSIPQSIVMHKAVPISPILAPMPNVIPTTPITQSAGAPNIPQSNVGPSTHFPQLIMVPSTQPNLSHLANVSPITPSTHTSQINSNPNLQMSAPKMQALTTPDVALVNNTKLNSTSVTYPSMTPHSPSVVYPSLSNITSPPMGRNRPTPSPMSPPPLTDTQLPLPGIIPISTQSFSYTRPKEFIAAQALSPIRGPSPTESPVPMLHELAAQIFPKTTRDLTSPINQLPPFPRKFPTRVLEGPSSPPYVSSPPLNPPGLVNSVFSFRTQSPPQASSPTSSSSSPSPIQNPVAFLSSVLPSLPTSPPTNAMGLPMRAPPGPQSALKRSQRGSRLISDDEIRDSKELLLQDIEKKLQFRDEPLRFGQQEYKVSSFEQRLMSEIEFRLERTPVEESDDEVQHDEIPTGKCIAPIFDKKLKHFRAVEGIPVTFTCKVVGIPIPKVYWFKDGKQILKKNEHYRKIREGDGTCSLHIETVTNDDDGNYTVMAANPQGRISCSGHLIVQTGPVRNRPVVHSQRVRARVQEVEGEPTQERFFRPHFLQAPGDMLAHEGRLCRLDCKVSGLPHPEIMWLLNGKPIYPDVTHRMLVRENGIHSLVIDPLTQADDGTYTCIASNKAGQSSFCLQLKVVEKEMKAAPRFVEKLQNTGIAEGAAVRLECRVAGMPQPVIYWKKDNDTIPHSRDRVSMHQDTTGYVCLLIQPTRKEDAGWYTVSAKNEAGIISCTARLDIYAQWHQHVHPPMKKSSLTGSRYAALTGQGLDIKSAFPMSESGPHVLFRERESDEL
ncbi:myopalladin isoform 2 [Danio rerio]|uniref:Myopalladin n=1 Tax=Danio rerio TaxID=7955 RepID=A0AB13A3L9_DANRE|nr:myopalladin isoform 2 [Danio rerio]|eukprot:XP_021336585.1 myopalladin isoform X2 [Danio rerio]